MNFFAAQDHARRATKWLVVGYGLATALIVAGVTLVVAVGLRGVAPGGGVTADPGLLIVVAAATLLLIVGASLVRTARLSAGGGKVAEELGGIPLGDSDEDPLHRRLRNVVEEMSIASGVPVPAIYVLEREQGINAFAAGFSPDDAAVAVTRGALEVLDRDELQGVIAHEFSHILNGDMRLNIRLIGVLFGIMVIGLIGRSMLRGGRYSGGGLRFGSRGRGSGGIVMIGLGLAVLGGIGVFFARLIKAAVSRQRESLADASAVQFTRQTDGIANALKKIGGYSEHSYLTAADPEEVSHMLFALGARFSALFATHPPLAERIRALDPQFDPAAYPTVRRSTAGADADARAAGFATSGESDVIEARSDEVFETIGRPEPRHLRLASSLHAAIPEPLLIAAHSDESAWLLALSLFLPRENDDARRGLDFLERRLGTESATTLTRYLDLRRSLDLRFDFVLLELLFPALRRSSRERQDFLLDTGRALTEQDGSVELREYCLYQVLVSSLAHARDPDDGRRAGQHHGKRAIRAAALALLATLARFGAADEDSERRAFESGIAEFGRWGTDSPFDPDAAAGVAELNTALGVLRHLGPRATGTLVRAAMATVLADGRVTSSEAEILRALCATLGSPLPPIIAGPDPSSGPTDRELSGSFG